MSAMWSCGYHRQGRGLWDMLALIGLVVSLAGLGFFALRPGQSSGAHSRTVEHLRATGDALEKYAVDNAGQFPTTRQGLQALLQKPTEEPLPLNWRGPYLEDPRQLQDAWGKEFLYVAPGGGDPPRAYDLWSLGADQQEGGQGTAADVRSWESSTLLPPS
ncbi:MAG: type II secretion system major pseudopilin GspG [candidate division WS1 bacterium]|jgi:general secretion pathway protein G|nr:type II secretion system major pseudopilin GspG [candidate division WS1 bacterium]